MALRGLRGDGVGYGFERGDCRWACAGGGRADEVSEVWREWEIDTGSGRAGYVVQLGAVAFFDFGLARLDCGFARVLSYELVDQRLRHFIFLGFADDHGGFASGFGRDRSGANSLPAIVFAFFGADCGRREDVQD